MSRQLSGTNSRRHWRKAPEREDQIVKLFIIYTAVEDGQQVWPDGRSLPLQRIAGSNVLGHVLNQLRDVHPDELVLVVDRDEETIASWIKDTIPQLETKLITAAPGSSPLQALAQCRDHFDKGPLLIALGSTITEADFRGLDQSPADVTLFTQPPQWDQPLAAAAQDKAGPPWAGVCCFRRGTDLRSALDQAAAAHTTLGALINDLPTLDLHIEKRPAALALDTSTAAGLLYANARLLGLGYGSEDAIERSYVEDFTVIPPVFLHETAVIENAVVGPFTNVEAGARISGSVIRNSLIGAEASVENVVLDGALIGSRARVTASGNAVFVQDDKEITL